MTYMADTLEQIAERIKGHEQECDLCSLMKDDAMDATAECDDARLLREALSALQSLARERDPEFLSALLSKEQAMRREAEAALATLREAKG
jgi:hypothetical protein